MNALTRARRSDAARFVRDVGVAWAKHRLSTHAAAIAFRILVSYVPFALLGLAVLGALGLRDVWTESLAPAVEDRVTAPVFDGLDYSVEKILSQGSAGAIAFASVLLYWQLSRAVRALMVALNEIHEIDDERSPWLVLLTTLWLAAAIGLCIVFSVLAVVVLPRLADGLVRIGLTVAAYAIAVLLLGVVVALLVRYAPAEHPSPEWASIGGGVVVGVWLLTSAGFGWWAGSLANYKSAVGSLTVFLILTAYTFTSAAIFLIGVEIDQRAQVEEAAHA